MKPPTNPFSGAARWMRVRVREYTLADLNTRFYVRCARLGVVPPIGPAGLPPMPEEQKEAA